MSRDKRLVLSSVCLFVGLILTSFGALLHDTAELILAGVATSLAVGMMLLAGVAPGRAGRMGSSRRRAVLAAVVVTVMGGLGLYANHFLPAQEFLGGGHGSGAVSCASHAMLTGLVCATGLLFLWRGTDPFTPGLTGALLGGFGAMLGVLGIGVACPSVEGWHLLVGHGSSVLLLSGLGWIAGRKWLTP